jgi:hypothetical protein
MIDAEFLKNIDYFNSYFSKNWEREDERKEIFITNNEEYMSLLKKYTIY